MNKIYIEKSFSEFNYKKKDSIIAILVYIYILVLTCLFGIYIYKSNINIYLSSFFKNKNLYKIIIQLPILILEIIPILLILKKSNHSLSSIGIFFENIKKQILLGIVFAVPFIITSIYINKYSIINFTLYSIVYQLIFTSLIEEIIFRGFIQSRLKGIIHNTILRTLVVGIMFGFLHLPFQLISNSAPLAELLLPLLISILTKTGMHVYYSFVYYKSNNLLAPIITHTIKNLVLI
ncbi:CPBP family intramembrane glutamic endopeptidase [Paraclostridium bifermentans]|uniref:CPBP family intramembrane glutamic endopeptidase n=1 Tax=Paraclostridium bifermentans TaxID=1490 RepID=UPI00189D7CAE|nr:CPBP family intramembrane glutamic endopeptidase [Paraclostridium bifermentans]